MRDGQRHRSQTGIVGEHDACPAGPLIPPNGLPAPLLAHSGILAVGLPCLAQHPSARFGGQCHQCGAELRYT